MERSVIQEISKAVSDFETNSLTFSERQTRKALHFIFSPLLEVEGYKPDKDSMRRHSYLDYIATKGKYNKRQTVAISYRKDLSEVTKDDIEELVAGCTIDGIDKVVLFSNAIIHWDAHLYDTGKYPVVFEYKTLSTIKDWISSIEADYDETEVTKLLRSCTQGFIELIVNNPGKTLSELEWRDIERVVAEIFRGMGFYTTLTPPAKDGGKDVIVELTNRKQSYIIEIKHWRSGQKVGNKSVKDFLKVVTKEKRAGGLFLSTYGFAENAIESLTTIEKKKVRFGKEDKIHSLCNTYLKKKSGLWLEDLDLQKILFENTFQ